MRGGEGNGRGWTCRRSASASDCGVCVRVKSWERLRKEGRVGPKNEQVVKELSSVPPTTLRRTSYPRARARIDISDQRRVWL